VTLEDEVDVLRRIPLFAKVEPSMLKLLAFTSQRVTYAKGQELFHQGDPGDAAYVIIKGIADVLVDAPDGPISVAQVKRNAFVGDIAILCDVPRTATVKAISELEALKILKEQFLQLIAEFPEIAVEVMRVLADRLSNTTAELTTARNRLHELGE
jgi:CRP-like cAMP-binding protein